MLHWLKKRPTPAPLETDGPDAGAGLCPAPAWGSTRGDAEGAKRPGGPPSFISEPVEPLQISNASGFQVHFVAGGPASARPEGRRFHAKLYLWTPLSVLQAHGRFVASGEASKPDEIPPEFGTWVDEPAAPAGWEPPELDEESDVGPVKPSVILPFLKTFRGIAESDLEPKEQARKFNRMHLLNPAWKPFVEALQRPSEIHPEGAPDLASVWFCPHLEANVQGLGPRLSAALYQAGFLTPRQIREASESDLLRVPGINKATLKRIRQ